MASVMASATASATAWGDDFVERPPGPQAWVDSGCGVRNLGARVQFRRFATERVGVADDLHGHVPVAQSLAELEERDQARVLAAVGRRRAEHGRVEGLEAELGQGGRLGAE